MRIFSLFFCVLIAACGGPPDAASGDERVACMVDGSATFEPVCSIGQASNERGLILTVSNPGGGFRRLLVTNDGRGVIAADGAELAVVTPVGEGLIEVAVGTDRYRLPATVKPVTDKAQ